MGQRASVSEYATVRVCLDQPTAVPGDVVSGEISAVVIARTRLGELDARLRCTLVAGVDADRSKSTLLDQNIVCKKFNAGYLEPGSYKFPFRFHLPRSAPPSTEFENVDHSAGAVVKVSVAYAVHAEVRGGGAGGSGWFSSKQVAHSQSLEVNATPTLQTITTGSLNSKVDSGFSLFRTHGSIQARAFCLPSSVRPGEKCAITVYLRNNTNAAFILRNVKLEQRVMARTRTAAREHSQKWVLHRSATHETEEEWKDPNDDGDDGDGSRGASKEFSQDPGNGGKGFGNTEQSSSYITTPSSATSTAAASIFASP
ncbi:Hypothetical Protein FCC1311_112042 [Hondaea fermentalgiana]|uniref:Uncharacterized protein n=1 Tax=Hondaea fermentalgiana TaxID=2315210 RepID=A0A2R5GVW2_9STRA|nr:Hypothetical Protein FCC1311_112042 [Hondaea fermentalgiana]|eukprot:GBG34982.1 Hypothetical Protein FCC1311_112042 [Hondaea fermentalgiana]